jgi:hypothetical protein
MPPALSLLANRLAASRATVSRERVAFGLVIILHLAALAVMLRYEDDVLPKVAFVLAWAILNCLWLVLLRRPLLAGVLSLALVTVLILLSQLKHSVLFMTVNFIDVMIIDHDTISFLLTVYPELGQKVAVALALLLPLLGLVWWLDPLRVRRSVATFAGAGALAALTGLALTWPADPYSEFYNGEYLSKFARSGVTATQEYFSHGFLDSDTGEAGHLKAPLDNACTPATKPPHIVMVFDESSFDLTMAPGIKVPPGYREHFTSFDGRNRNFIVEGVGGPSWFTEYNVLTGLSVRSYGRFADFVTRIAAGRVERGLPWALRKCGYKTFSFYSYLGAFLSARKFQATTGIENFQDYHALGAKGVEPDSFFYDAAARTLAREGGKQPLFLFVYTLANHFPWDYRWRPDLMPDWRDLGNGTEPDEYLRRQMISKRDYADFVARLKREFPDERFLIVRFGDHQTGFARNLIDPNFDDSFMARQIAAHDPRFLTTYYAIDVVNYQPADMSSALETLDAPYLPLVVLEAAGLPLDASFAEQKRIFQRCRGLFYRCSGGAEARRFNRLLIDAGLIKGL